MSSSNVVAIQATTANRAGSPHETAQVPNRPVDSISSETDLANIGEREQGLSTAPVTPVGTKLVIDPVVRSWLPPRSAVELAWLTTGTPDVANNPILVWERGAKLVVLEDADFAERCQRLGIEPDCKWSNWHQKTRHDDSSSTASLVVLTWVASVFTMFEVLATIWNAPREVARISKLSLASRGSRPQAGKTVGDVVSPVSNATVGSHASLIESQKLTDTRRASHYLSRATS